MGLKIFILKSIKFNNYYLYLMIYIYIYIYIYKFLLKVIH